MRMFFFRGWATAIALVFVLCEVDILPSTSKIEVQVVNFRGLCPLSPWVLIAGLLAFFPGLILSPYVPNLLGKEICFLDVVSINQSDRDLMERGIYGLGGFLSMSKQLRVLWSPDYLQRLWCVYLVEICIGANVIETVDICRYRRLIPSGQQSRSETSCFTSLHVFCSIVDIPKSFSAKVWTGSVSEGKSCWEDRFGSPLHRGNCQLYHVGFLRSSGHVLANSSDECKTYLHLCRLHSVVDSCIHCLPFSATLHETKDATRCRAQVVRCGAGRVPQSVRSWVCLWGHHNVVWQ